MLLFQNRLLILVCVCVYMNLVVKVSGVTMSGSESKYMVFI